MTLAQLRTALRQRLEETGTAVYWTDAEIDAALNEAYAEISDETEWHEEIRVIDLLHDRPYYDLRTVLGDSFLSLGPARDDAVDRWLRPSRCGDLDGRDRRWERVIGRPERLIRRGLWWLGYWPRASEDAGAVSQYITSLPDPLDEDTDAPEIPEAFHEGLIEGALTELWSQDAETARALTAWAAYLSHETGLKGFVQQRIGVPIDYGHGHDAR